MRRFGAPELCLRLLVEQGELTCLEVNRGEGTVGHGESRGAVPTADSKWRQTNVLTMQKTATFPASSPGEHEAARLWPHIDAIWRVYCVA